MKKLLLATLVSLLIMGEAKAQTFNNPGMETWVNFNSGLLPPTQLTRPANWFSADSILFFYSPLLFNNSVVKQLFKSTDANQGSFSAQIVTRTQDTTKMPGVLANAQPQVDILSFNPANPISAISYNGGTPITQRIGSVSAWVKYKPNGLDAGNMLVQAVLAGAGAGGKDSVVGTGTLPIVGNINSFTQKTVNVVYNNPTVVPNKILVVFTSSNFLTAKDSSAMWVDDVTMTAVSGTKEVLMDGETVEVYPNPANQVLHLSTSINVPLTLSFVDVQGKTVATQNFRSKTSINVANWTRGFYFYQLHNSDGVLVRKGRVAVQ